MGYGRGDMPILPDLWVKSMVIKRIRLIATAQLNPFCPSNAPNFSTESYNTTDLVQGRFKATTAAHANILDAHILFFVKSNL